MTDYLFSFGYPGLLLFSFMAATIVPVSSETAVVSALALDMKPLPVLLFATIGNCSAVLFNYWLGYKGEEKFLQRHLQKKAVSKAYSITKRWGKWALLLSWLPVLGDPITILAGVIKINLGLFILVSFTLRFMRYAFIIELFEIF